MRYCTTWYINRGRRPAFNPRRLRTSENVPRAWTTRGQNRGQKEYNEIMTVKGRLELGPAGGWPFLSRVAHRRGWMFVVLRLLSRGRFIFGLLSSSLVSVVGSTALPDGRPSREVLRSLQGCCWCRQKPQRAVCLRSTFELFRYRFFMGFAMRWHAFASPNPSSQKW